MMYTRYTHVHHVPHAEHVERSIGRNSKAWSRQCHTIIHLSRSWVSELSAQMLMHKLSPVTVIFYLLLEQLANCFFLSLDSFSTLPSSSILPVLNLHRKVRKHVHFNHNPSRTDRHTYILSLHDYEPHAKVASVVGTTHLFSESHTDKDAFEPFLIFKLIDRNAQLWRLKIHLLNTI